MGQIFGFLVYFSKLFSCSLFLAVQAQPALDVIKINQSLFTSLFTSIYLPFISLRLTTTDHSSRA